MNINEVTLNSIDRYFNYLSNFGIAPESQQKVILVLLLIQTIQYSEIGELVTEKDYKIFKIQIITDIYINETDNIIEINLKSNSVKKFNNPYKFNNYNNYNKIFDYSYSKEEVDYFYVYSSFKDKSYLYNRTSNRQVLSRIRFISNRTNS